MTPAASLATPAAFGNAPSPTASASPFGTAPVLAASSATAAATTPTGSALAGQRWYVDPNSHAAQQVAAWKTSDPSDAAEIEKIAAQPQAIWFGDWNSDVASAVRARVNAASAAGEVAQLVAYDIPLRDCGGYSSGGASSPDAYRSWIRAFASGIGTAPAVVILEPDALAGMGCLSAADQATRLALLSDAVSVLTALHGVAVYIDAGHAGWQSAATMAARLRSAGVQAVQGFALDVSNFDATSNEASYGQAISSLISGKHFVIDTSRNGLGSNGQWCNPAGRALGATPTAATGYDAVDAFLWIKHPGESDGTCNGGPSAGTWWPSYALGLAQRAAY